MNKRLTALFIGLSIFCNNGTTLQAGKKKETAQKKIRLLHEISTKNARLYSAKLKQYPNILNETELFCERCASVAKNRIAFGKLQLLWSQIKELHKQGTICDEEKNLIDIVGNLLCMSNMDTLNLKKMTIIGQFANYLHYTHAARLLALEKQFIQSTRDIKCFENDILTIKEKILLFLKFKHYEKNYVFTITPFSIIEKIKNHYFDYKQQCTLFKDENLKYLEEPGERSVQKEEEYRVKAVTISKEFYKKSLERLLEMRKIKQEKLEAIKKELERIENNKTPSHKLKNKKKKGHKEHNKKKENLQNHNKPTKKQTQEKLNTPKQKKQETKKTDLSYSLHVQEWRTKPEEKFKKKNPTCYTNNVFTGDLTFKREVILAHQLPTILSNFYTRGIKTRYKREKHVWDGEYSYTMPGLMIDHCAKTTLFGCYAWGIKQQQDTTPPHCFHCGFTIKPLRNVLNDVFECLQKAENSSHPYEKKLTIKDPQLTQEKDRIIFIDPKNNITYILFTYTPLQHRP